MPKVSEAYRQARREQVVAAALRVLGRRGLHALTMADIIAESGLSAGSVYSHFSTKQEIVQLVASRVIGERAERLRSESEVRTRSPLEVVHWWLSGLEQDEVPYGAVLQIWGEAASDADIQVVVERQMSAMEDAFTVAVKRWLASSGREPAAARDTARAMVTVCQGFIVRAAILGPQDLSSCLTGLDPLVTSR